MSREQTIVELAGGEYLGTSDGMVWWNDPLNQATLVTAQNEILDCTEAAAVDLVKEQMTRKRLEFAGHAPACDREAER